MLTDIEIAQQAQLKRIEAIATDNNVDPEILEQYGKYKAKVDFVPNQAQISQGKLILVTATTPNKSGSGKTTTSVALAQGLNYIGKKSNRRSARTLSRTLFWNERWCRGRWILPSSAHGRHQPALHRRFSRNHFGKQHHSCVAR